jgi:hypothetical protein
MKVSEFRKLIREEIRRVLQEDIRVTTKDGDLLEIDIMVDGTKVGNVDMESYDDGKTYTISGSNIDEKFRGRGLYGKALLQVLDKYPDISIYSAFRSPEAIRAWKALMNKLGNKYSIKQIKQDGQLVFVLTKNK